jgi:hypothetical protein
MKELSTFSDLTAKAVEVERWVRDYRAQIACRAQNCLPDQLTEVLIQPLQEFLSPESYLYIVPHGLFASASFHALPWNGRYLGEEFRVGYAPSAFILGIALGRIGRREGQAIFGDPELQSQRSHSITRALKFTH